MKIIKTRLHEHKIGHEVHEDKQEWRKHLVLVSSLPNRFLGIVDTLYDTTAPYEEPSSFSPFTLYGSLLYIAELAFSPLVEVKEVNGQKIPVTDAEGQPKILGIQGRTKLHVVIPYDFLGPAEIEITQAQHIIWIDRQEKEFKDWVYREYLNFFDPPRIHKPV